MNNNLKKFLIANVLIFAGLIVLLAVVTTMATPTANSGTKFQDTTGVAIEKEVGFAIGAGLAIGLAGLGAGVGMGSACSAAIGAITEKPETLGQSLIFIVLIEAIAIYGFVIAFLLSTYI